MSILSIPLLLTKKFRSYLFKFRELFILISLIVIYSFFRDLIGGEFVKLPSNITLYTDVYLLPIIILYFFHFLSVKDNLIEDIIITGIIASLFTLLSILSPAIGDFFRFDLLKTNEFTDLVAYRTFGLAELLTFTYGITQGVIFCLILFFSKQNKFFLFFIPLILISILFNARTGFTPVIIALIFYLINYFNIKLVVNTTILAVIALFIIPQITFSNEQQRTVEWGLDFFYQLNDLFTGSQSSDSNTFDALFGYMVVLPSTDLQWLFGTGEYIFAKSHGNDSDVGYIIQLYYGGIFYIILLFLIVIWMYKSSRIYKKYNKPAFLISLVLILTTIIVNVKGEIFSSNGYLRLCVLIFLFFNIKTSKSKNFKKIGVKINRNN